MMDRTKGIGGTDIAAIMGVSPWRCALDVYCEKRGLTQAELVTSEAAYWGTQLEAVIFRRYMTDLGCADDRDAAVIGSECVRDGWMIAHPDAIVSPRGESIRGVEIKTAGRSQAKRWFAPPDGMIPLEYELQCRWYMAVRELPIWDVAVLIGGQDYRCYRLARDADKETGIITAAKKFWTENVQAGMPPPPDSSEAATKRLALLYPDVKGEIIGGDADVESWAFKLRERKAALKQAEADVRDAENQIKAAIGDHAGVKGVWGMATWKTVEKAPYSVKASKYRQFRVTFAAEEDEDE